MRKEPKRMRVASLKELDALVGKYLTKETPQIFWEEQQICLRFESLEEALAAMHDPFYQQLMPKDARPRSALMEVQEFRPYSSELHLAWEVVEQLSVPAKAFHVQREGGRWVAAFGKGPPAASPSAPVAICLAALRATGLEVELLTERAFAPRSSSR